MSLKHICIILSFTFFSINSSSAKCLRNLDPLIDVLRIDTIPNQIKDTSKDLREDEAFYPGGDAAWTKYITAAIRDHIDELSRRTKVGTYTATIRFIIMPDGTIGDVSVVNSNNNRLSKVAINAIKDCNRWHPAFQHGRTVKAFREQSFTFAVEDDKK